MEVSLDCKNLQFVFFADCNLWIVQVNCGLLQKVQIHALCCTIYGIAQTVHFFKLGGPNTVYGF